MSGADKRMENALVDGWEAMADQFGHLGFTSCKEAQDAASVAIIAFLRGLAKQGDWIVTPSQLATQLEELRHD